MSKRVAHRQHFEALPVGVVRETAQSLNIANRKYEALQRKVGCLETELTECKKSLDQANVSKKEVIQEAKAEVSALKRVVHQLTVENGNLKARAMHPCSQEQVQLRQQRMQQLEEQLNRALIEKIDIEAKLQAENHSKVQLITKLSQVNGVNQSLTQQVQKLTQSRDELMNSEDPQMKEAIERNEELQRRIEFITFESDELMKADSLHKTTERDLKRSQRENELLSEDKRKLSLEIETSREEAANLRHQLEKSEWMNKMLNDQVDYCKRNSDMWLEQSRSLSAHLNRLSNGGMGLGQNQPNYAPNGNGMGASVFPPLHSDLSASRTHSMENTDFILMDQNTHAVKRMKREEPF